MKQRIFKMKLMWYLPAIIGGIRILLTIMTLTISGFDMSLKIFQIACLVGYCASLFSFYILFKDGTPIVSLALPTMLQCVFIFLFKLPFYWRTLLVLVVFDVCFLLVREIKSTSFPFEIEGEQENLDKNLDELMGDFK